MSFSIRAIGAVLAISALAACGGPSAATPSSARPSPAAASAAASASASASALPAVEATLRDFEIELAQSSFASPVTVRVTNEGPTPHNFTIRDAAGVQVATSGDLRRSESGAADVPELAAGEYTFFCSLPGHESLGMKGALTITP